MKKPLIAMTFRLCTIILALTLHVTHSWAVFDVADKSYTGAKIHTQADQRVVRCETYILTWVARPVPGATIGNLFSFFDPSSFWNEMTLETFDGGANTSNDPSQAQYIREGANQQFILHSSENIFDGDLHTFGIVYRPLGVGTSALMEWYIDGEKIREVNGDDINDLEISMRIHADACNAEGSSGLRGTQTTNVKNMHVVF